MADATPPVPGLRTTVVYGPVRSRRLGSSLGVNLLPAQSKVCSFDCPYCECGFNTGKVAQARWPSPDELGHALRRALERLPAPPDWITLSGSGEPTLHPRFAVAVERVLAARDACAPGTRVGLFSNGVLAGAPAVRAALLRLDGRFMKLDPGPPLLVNGVAIDPRALAETYRALRPVTVQAMVARGHGWDGATDASLAAWLPLLARADPAAVHLYSIARPPADSRVTNVTRERLLAMAAAIRDALPHTIVEVF
jgi:wyosine [tRNA(Phe)-imidazoG37] synthetase (radical SAM superfamily)